MAKKFKFNLQSVLNFKEFKEELLKQDLAKLIKNLNEEIYKYNELKNEIIKTKDKLNQKLLKDIKSSMVIENNRYLEYLNNLIHEQIKIIKAIEQTIDVKRNEILKNEVEKRVIEKLKDKQLTVFEREISTKNQKNIDDITIQRFFIEIGEGKINGSIYSKWNFTYWYCSKY